MSDKYAHRSGFHKLNYYNYLWRYYEPRYKNKKWLKKRVLKDYLRGLIC